VLQSLKIEESRAIFWNQKKHSNNKIIHSYLCLIILNKIMNNVLLYYGEQTLLKSILKFWRESVLNSFYQ